MNYDLFLLLSRIFLLILVVASIFVIVVVIMQPANSEGIGAISGRQETFYGKNKSKTLESKMKKLTIISIIVLAVCMVAFTVLTLLAKRLLG
ncbi:MAG: preprotein translocase subunit SecG [Clostridia bacterium]|jgi:preprotein translocase subunit SecG|nr:preprotein translocase subunit SecG [Clostridia bacterium]